MPKSSPPLWHERAFEKEGLSPVAGLDEAGRGAWAGPVTAGAVILPLDDKLLLKQLEGVRDSKECSADERDAYYDLVMASAVSAASGMASALEIDRIGIVPATRLAMMRALEKLSVEPQALLIDYLRLMQVQVPQRSLVRGETQSLSIAAASIIAKVTRDRLMIEQDATYPVYGFARHKGYGTSEHRTAIQEHGPCDIHRHSFSPIRLRLLEVDSPDEDSSGS